MKKYFMFVLLFVISFHANAMVNFDTKNNKVSENVKVGGFINYAPFGRANVVPPLVYETAFSPVLDELSKGDAYKYTYSVEGDYEDVMNGVADGSIDLVVGAYYDTKNYDNLELVMPAIFSNPISIIMLPSRISELKSAQDLNSLRGGVSSQEYFSDFMNAEIQKFSPKVYDDSNKMFEALFKKEIDYILISYYWGNTEVSRLGLSNQVSFSKQSLWNVPVFIGVSKFSPYRGKLVGSLKKALSNPQMHKKAQEYLIKVVNDIKKDNVGVVAPAYSIE